MARNGLPIENQSVEPEESKRPEKTNGKDVHVLDPIGNKITLQMDTWEKHIAAKHPEIREMLKLVMETLSSPQIVIQQGLGGVCFYYRLTGRSFYRYNDIYMSVIVDLDEITKIGVVRTAYLVKEIQKGRVIWMQRN
jgi:hypothetical protein